MSNLPRVKKNVNNGEIAGYCHAQFRAGGWSLSEIFVNEVRLGHLCDQVGR